jgi:hypothetical protein
LPDTWEDWLNDTFGQDWLLNHYYTDIQLEWAYRSGTPSFMALVRKRWGFLFSLKMYYN